MMITQGGGPPETAGLPLWRLWRNGRRILHDGKSLCFQWKL